MAAYDNLRAVIAANIYQNNNNEVTADMVKTAMEAMVASLGAEFQFGGMAEPSDNPGTPDYKVAYLASTPGTYTNFGGLVVADGEVVYLKWDGTAWSKEVTGAATAAAVAAAVIAAYDRRGAGRIDRTLGDYGQLIEVGTAGVIKVSGFYLAIAGTKIVNGYQIAGHSYRRVSFYDKDFKFISSLFGSSGSTYDLELQAADIPASAVYFRANLQYQGGHIEEGVNAQELYDLRFMFSSHLSEGVFNNDGTVHASSSYPCLTDVFKAIPGTLIHGLFSYSASYTTVVVFYDAAMNILSTVTYPNTEDMYLTTDNIPAGAVFFRACLRKDIGFVRGVPYFAPEFELFDQKTKEAMGADGFAVPYVSNVLTGYFYAKPGTFIIKAFASGSLALNVAFYTESLDFISGLLVTNGQSLALTGSNIPSGAVYFRACVNASAGCVYGIPAPGLEARVLSKRSILLAHENGKIPTIGPGSTTESVRLRYANTTRIFTRDNYAKNALNRALYIEVPHGSINIPRYGSLYIDVVNERLAVASSNYTVVDTATGYDIINGTAYYGVDNLPHEQFFQIMNVGPGYALGGPLIDCISDLRLQRLESAVSNLDADGSIYDPVVQAAKCAEFDVSTKTDIPPALAGLLWFSDIHADESALNYALAQAAKYEDFISAIISTGDQLLNYFTDDFDWWTADDVLLVLGNHDAWISKAMYDTGDYDEIVERQYGDTNFYIIKQKECYDKFFASRISGWGVTQPADAATDGKCYYYKDFDAVRLIVLDCMHYGSPDDLDGNNESIQNAWLQVVLADALANEKPVAIASHFYPGTPTPIDCTYSAMFQGNGSDKLNSLARQAVADFIDNGGEFVCWLVGHTHQDAISNLSSDPRQLIVNVTTASIARATYQPHVRIAGTATEQALNFFCIDSNRKVVKNARFGAAITDMMETYRALVYRYKATAAGQPGVLKCD